MCVCVCHVMVTIHLTSTYASGDQDKREPTDYDFKGSFMTEIIYLSTDVEWTILYRSVLKV